MFSTDIISEITAAANALNVEPAALLAVAEVESGGKAFALINGRREPLIRFEGHYFDRRLNGPTQVAARKARLAHPRAGAIANPATQAARWAILRRAATIDHQAAHESVSWGLGQVMGAHWRWLGYANIDELVAEARRSVAGQATLMARYVDKAGLTTTLRNHDWAAFARGYNGPDYKRHGYDRKIAEAYARYVSSGPAPKPGKSPSLLRRGSAGRDVLELQTMLVAAGHAVTRDGQFGPQTALAVQKFQREHGLDADGIAGPLTMAALARALGGGQWRFGNVWLRLRNRIAALFTNTIHLRQ